MSNHVIGLVLIDAPHSALNNAGLEASQSTENIVTVKTLRKGKKTYPYVSGQAWRSWWRRTLEKDLKWRLSPIDRAEKTAFTAADPVEYPDDDVFGYMRAQSIEIKEEGKEGKEGKKKKQNITVTRLSPLKCSPLISIEHQQPTNDFGVMARHEGNPVPYEHQFYSTVLKGIFSLDLSAVGAFWDINKTGYKNISEEYTNKIKENGGKRADDKSPWTLPKDIRLQRSKDTIKALSIISGGAQLTSHLTDVTPKLIILAVIQGGNHPFMNLVVEREGKGAEFSIQALKQVLDDYKDRLTGPVYVGRREGFMDELNESFEHLSKDHGNVIYGSPNEVIGQLADSLENYIEE
jgi:CRISPR-associated protein Cst2